MLRESNHCSLRESYWRYKYTVWGNASLVILLQMEKHRNHCDSKGEYAYIHLLHVGVIFLSPLSVPFWRFYLAFVLPLLTNTPRILYRTLRFPKISRWSRHHISLQNVNSTQKTARLNEVHSRYITCTETLLQAATFALYRIGKDGKLTVWIPTLVSVSVLRTHFLAEHFWLRNVSTDTHILAPLNIVCSNDRYPKLDVNTRESQLKTLKIDTQLYYNI